MPRSITDRATDILGQLESAHIHEVTGLSTEVNVSRAATPSVTEPSSKITGACR